MTADNNQNDLWNSETPEDGFFGSEEPVDDMFGGASAGADKDVLSELPEQTLQPAGSPEMSPVTSTAPVAKAQTDGYVVLARKYRPQTFDDIVGQEGVQQALRGAIATGQISHSYLFSGPRGTGKTSTARILAKALNCQDNGPRPDPCGRCASCRAITVGSSLDVMEIDAASNTGVDNIRELKSGVVLAPFSRYKVYIVDEVHMLSNQAFNALLKTLEEPPAQVIFILATTELHKVPETIISRCQTFIFRRFSLTELKNQLGSILDIEANNRGLTVSAEDREKILDLIARSAEGGMRDAQVTLDQVLVLSKGVIDFESVRRFLGMADTEALDSFVQLINQRKPRELLELIDQLVIAGQDLELFIKGACEYMRDLLLIKCAGRETSMINVSEDRGKELETIASGLSSQALVASIDQFLNVVGDMKVSGQPRIVLELAVLKLTLPDPARGIENIVKRLDALEKELKSGGGVNPAPAPQAPTTAPATSHFQAETVGDCTSDPNSQNTPAAHELDKPVSQAPHPDVINSSPEVTTEPVQVAGDADNMVELIGARLKSDYGMLGITFEKVICGQEFDGQTLTLHINQTSKMSYNQMMRPQNTTTLSTVVKGLFGPGVQVKLMGIDGPASAQPGVSASMETPASPIPAFESRHNADKPARINHPSDVSNPGSQIQRDPDGVVTAEALEDVPLKIYYPEEIREKTMVEVRDSEFQQLLAADSALKDLVEKTKSIFGVDDKQVKFHRSTLA